MLHADIETGSTGELWSLHQTITDLLRRRTEQELLQLETRLAAIQRSTQAMKRSYTRTKMMPKFRNPEIPEQTWTGRGRRPQWVHDFVATGKSIAELKIG